VSDRLSERNDAVAVFTARQPIYDRRGAITAYELLFRDSNGRSVGRLSSHQETEALAHSILDIGLDKLVGSHRAFINTPVELLNDPTILLLPPKRVVLEVLEDVEPTEELFNSLRTLRSKGYTIALDDFVFDGRLDKLLPYCQIVKVEFPAADKSQLKKNVAKLKARGITTLAEKVEERDEQKLCMSCGFDLFQGYFFAKPELVSGSVARAGNSTLAKLIQELQNPGVSIVRIEELLSSDARLTHQLFRITRSAASGGSAGVTSIRSALMTVGTARLTALVGLMMIAEQSNAQSDVLTLGTVRAKLCEELAIQMGFRGGDRHFTVGLLSVLDAVLGMRMTDVIEQMPLADDLREALIDPTGSGELCKVLRMAKAIESGDWKAVQEVDVHPTVLGDCYMRAIHWSQEIQSQLAA
jgi:EAL and modified HD-GYP domain-containing signal transduction protein